MTTTTETPTLIADLHDAIKSTAWRAENCGTPKTITRPHTNRAFWTVENANRHPDTDTINQLTDTLNDLLDIDEQQHAEHPELCTNNRPDGARETR